MPDVPLCGACRSRPRERKRHDDGGPIYYDWCAVCRRLAGLDRVEAWLKRFRASRGDEGTRTE